MVDHRTLKNTSELSLMEDPHNDWGTEEPHDPKHFRVSGPPPH